MAPAIVQEIVTPVIAVAVDDEEKQQQQEEEQERQFLLSYDSNNNPFQNYDSIQKLQQQQQRSQLHCWVFNKSSHYDDYTVCGESLTVGITSDTDDDEEKLSEDWSRSNEGDENNSNSNDTPTNPLLKKYCDALERNPLWVKSWTAFVLLGCADALAQCIEHHRGIYKYCHSTPTTSTMLSSLSLSITFCFDIYRMIRFATFGLVGTPWAHYYYTWLDTTLPPTTNPWTVTTFVKVFIDQFLQAPILLGLIIIGMGLMQFESIEEIKHDLDQQYISTLIANCKFHVYIYFMSFCMMHLLACIRGFIKIENSRFEVTFSNYILLSFSF